MQQEMKQAIRIDDFIAEVLEAEAGKMPLGCAEQAKVLRDHAAKLRASNDTKMVKVTGLLQVDIE